MKKCYECKTEIDEEDFITMFINSEDLHFCNEKCMDKTTSRYDPMPFGLGETK